MTNTKPKIKMTESLEYLKNEVYKMWGEQSQQAIHIREAISHLKVLESEAEKNKNRDSTDKLLLDTELLKQDYYQNITDLKTFYKDELLKKDLKIKAERDFINEAEASLRSLLFALNNSNMFNVKSSTKEGLGNLLNKFDERKKEEVRKM